MYGKLFDTVNAKKSYHAALKKQLAEIMGLNLALAEINKALDVNATIIIV